MKHARFASIFLSVFLFQFSANAADQISKEKIQSQGKQRSYYLFVPTSVKTGTSVPLVILLHGSGRNGLSLVEKWKDLASKEGFIIVGPDAANVAGWRVPDDGPEFIHDLCEMLIAKYPIEPHRVYLFGHSAGAVFALDLAMFESNYFAAVAVHAGAWRSDKEFSLVDFAQRKIPLQIIVGNKDQFFPLESVAATEAALKERGFSISVSIMKNHDHWYYDLAPEINSNAWEFLKQNVLPAERRHITRSFGPSPKDLNTTLKQIQQLRLQADNSIQRFYAKEDELRGKDYIKDKQVVSEIARAQIQLLTEGAGAFRDASATAEKASSMNISASYQQYLSLVAKASLRRAEYLELLRTRSDLLLTNEEPNSINTKRSEVVRKAEPLIKEAEELERQAEQLIGH